VVICAGMSIVFQDKVWIVKAYRLYWRS
jgi:hypothetical protein